MRYYWRSRMGARQGPINELINPCLALSHPNGESPAAKTHVVPSQNPPEGTRGNNRPRKGYSLPGAPWRSGREGLPPGKSNPGSAHRQIKPWAVPEGRKRSLKYTRGKRNGSSCAPAVHRGPFRLPERPRKVSLGIGAGGSCGLRPATAADPQRQPLRSF